MKTNFTNLKTLLIIITVSIQVSIAKAQCVTPSMSWHNPVLIAGTAGQPGAEYKFPAVTPGVNAIVKILALNGGANLSNIDEDVYGYSAAWQPVVKTPTTSGASTSYVSFSVSFKDEATGAAHIYDCFQLSFIDVDGDGDKVKEFVATKSPDNVSVSNNSALTVTNLGGNLMQATGPLVNYNNIDTSAWNTNVNFKYRFKQKVNEVRVGCITMAGFNIQDRYSCGYFAQVTMQNEVMLPLKFIAFDAGAVNNIVSLNWVTENEINNDHFDVERSFDGINYVSCGIVPAANGVTSYKKTYSYIDNNATLKNSNKVYYRLKQSDVDGKSTYSSVLIVRLFDVSDAAMQVSPNPFAESISARFTGAENGIANLQILNTNGQKVITQQATMVKGNNAVQLQGLTKLAPGVYIAQLVVNGVIVSNQKIIKN